MDKTPSELGSIGTRRRKNVAKPTDDLVEVANEQLMRSKNQARRLTDAESQTSKNGAKGKNLQLRMTL